MLYGKSQMKRAKMKRREFLKITAAGAAGIYSHSAEASSGAARPRTAVPSLQGLPLRRLGRTGVNVPVLSLGLATMGHSLYEPDRFEEVVHAAIDAGMTYLDAAPVYGVAEERLKPVLAKRRREVFLVSKVERQAYRKDDTLRLIEASLKKMGVDYLDLCHVHSMGDFDVSEVVGRQGCLAGLKEARKRGLIRYIGISGHSRPGRFVPVIETGEIDVVMMVLNFVDRYTYNFENRVLPTARKHNTAIVAMKAIGGPAGFKYHEKTPALLASPEHYRLAIRYVLQIPDLATCVMGLSSVAELRAAITAVQNAESLTPKEEAWLEKEGRWLANKWKDHFGPID